MSSARRTVLMSVGLLLLRRRLRRSDSLAAPLALIALDVFGPRVLQGRRLAAWGLGLAAGGALVAGVVWWARRRRSAHDGEVADVA